MALFLFIFRIENATAKLFLDHYTKYNLDNMLYNFIITLPQNNATVPHIKCGPVYDLFRDGNDRREAKLLTGGICEWVAHPVHRRVREPHIGLLVGLSIVETIKYRMILFKK